MAKKKKKKQKGFKLERRKSYSSIYEQMVRISPMIASILKKDLKSRNDDNILVFKVWKKQGLKDNMSVKSCRYKVIMGKLALMETIMRTRRMLQEKHESLRGKMYAKRKRAEELMKTQLKLF